MNKKEKLWKILQDSYSIIYNSFTVFCWKLSRNQKNMSIVILDIYYTLSYLYLLMFLFDLYCKGIHSLPQSMIL